MNAKTNQEPLFKINKGIMKKNKLGNNGGMILMAEM